MSEEKAELKRAAEAFAKAWHGRDGLLMPWDQCPESYKENRRQKALAEIIHESD